MILEYETTFERILVNATSIPNSRENKHWFENKHNPKRLELKISIDAKISMVDRKVA